MALAAIHVGGNVSTSVSKYPVRLLDFDCEQRHYRYRAPVGDGRGARPSYGRGHHRDQRQ